MLFGSGQVLESNPLNLKNIYNILHVVLDGNIMCIFWLLHKKYLNSRTWHLVGKLETNSLKCFYNFFLWNEKSVSKKKGFVMSLHLPKTARCSWSLIEKYLDGDISFPLPNGWWHRSERTFTSSVIITYIYITSFPPDIFGEEEIVTSESKLQKEPLPAGGWSLFWPYPSTSLNAYYPVQIP